MKIRLLTEAEAELDAVIAYYDERAGRLGQELSNEVRLALQ